MKNLFSGIVKSIFRNNTKSPKGDSLVSERDKAAVRKNGSRLGLPIALFTLLMGSGTTAFAGTYACGPASEGGDFQVLDGYNLPGGMTLAEFENLSSLSFVGDCTIKNFPFDNGITGFGSGSTLLNFNLPDKVTGATIVMDDVWYNGNMSCSNLPPSVVIWWVNGAWNSIDDKCQDFLPPELDGLRKLNPGSETTQSIGVPFTYTLTASEMVEISYADGSYSWVADTAPGTDSSGPDDLTYVRIEDDLTAHGADLSYVSYNAYLVDGLTGAYVSPFTFDIAPTPGQTNLVFQSSNPTAPGVVVPANHKLVVELTVVLDDTAANTPGTSFTNEVDWYLSKTVTNTGGVDRRIENVPGHTEATDPMTIVGPYLQVSKTSPETTLSAGESAPFTVDVYNSGLFDAWDPVIVDQLPAGMCFNDPTPGLTVEHVDTVGTSTPVAAANYTLTWDGGTETNPCEIRLTTTDLKLAPQEHLVINYDAVLDTAPLSGELFTNVASADTWYNADSTITTRKVYSEPATDGTTGDNTDSEDAHTITAAAPYLQVSKDSTVSTLNVGPPATPYTIDVYNTGDGSAWDPIIVDYLPAGMCQYDATSNLTAQLFDTDGTTTLGPVLVENTDYTLVWTGGSAAACQFTLTTTNIEIGPQQHLIISYDAQLDLGAASGDIFTNVASADYWYNAPSSVGTRTEYEELGSTGTITDDTDSEDAYSVTAAVAGYYFLKSVDNLTTGVNGATTALPGDTLRYTLSLQNFTQPTLSVSELTDQLPAELDYSTFSFVSSSFPVAYDWDSATGILSFPAFLLEDTDSFEIQFEITLYPYLADGVSVDNFAKLSGTYNSGADTLTDALSDDPNDADGPVELISSTLDPADPDYSARNDTSVTIITPGALSKLESKPEVTIGDSFTYTITVPQTTVGVGLYDVKVVDDFAATGMVLTTTASATLASGTQSWTNLSVAYDAGLSAYVIQDTAGGGIDIPPGDQAIITVNATLDNDEINQSTLATSVNSAYYTYNKRNGIATNTGEGAAGTSGLVSVVEPDLTVDKGVENVTAPGEPAQTGQTLRYTVDILNGGSSEAFDVNIADTLPANLLMDDTSVTATIGGVDVAGFNPVPSTINGAKVWGNQNGDDTLDIGVGETLRLTYDVFVLSTDGTDLLNSVYVDWTSLDGVQTDERTGDGCPTLTAPALNDYCSAEAFATIQTTDTNAIVKTILGDSNPDLSDPPVLRVGDTVTYQLAVQLHEGTTPNVLVQDILPAGMQLTADPTYSTSAGATFSYTLITSPAASDSGTLVWDFGDVDNQSATLGLDEILIEYTAVVVTADTATTTAVAHVEEITDPASTNHATLAYTGGDPTSADLAVYDRLNSEALLDIYQPVMTPISKVDYGTGRTGTGTSGDPYQVDIVNDTMNFRLQTCNDTGLAPAYNLAIKDTLPAQMDVTSIAGPVVKVGLGTDPTSAVAVTEGAANDYVYTLTGSVMDFVFTDNRPIAPGECVFVEYDIGFDAGSITPTTPDWFNTAEVVNYWSLPTSSGRKYTPTDTDSVYMTNTATLLDPTKTIAQPVSPTTTVTIGEEVQYTITIPATNATLSGVVVTDILDPALSYVGATEANGLGLSVTPTAVATGTEVSIAITDSIPAGQDAVITLRAQVADNGTAVAGYSFDNQADYTYNGTTYTSTLAGELTVVEPQLVPTKSVTPPATDPVAGDTLSYTITIPAQTATNTSQAFDLTVVDTLGDGLSYVTSSAAINGMTVSAPLPEPTLGTSGTQQTLTWAGLDIPYNTEVTITYDVLVQDTVVPNQTLTNTADFEWTSLDTVVTGERTYTATDSTTLTVADTAWLEKAVVADSYVDANPAAPSTADDSTVRIGDTVDYQLTLNLQEGTTELVTVTDLLPTGLAFDSLVSVVAGTGITHSIDPVNVTVDGTTGDVTFELGNVVHTPDADADDAIVITYRVRVLKDTLTHQAITTPITNGATLDYTGAPATTPLRLQSSADITVWQPVIDSLTKTDRNGLTSTAQIDDVANTTMAFRLHACNSTGAAPAYSMTVTDQLDTTYFDETSISIVGVSIDGTPTGNYTYTYTAPNMVFAVNDPVYPGQCVDIDFDIGFRTDFGAGNTWNNSFDVTEYWSLQQPDSNAQLYTPVTLPDPFVMTNNANITPPLKELLSPAEATIGEEVVYRITVPSTPNDASTMYDVAISDPLDPLNGNLNLEYASATVTCPTCVGVNNTSNVGDSSMDITIDEIPPGERAIIELHARVRNVPSAQQGVAIDNIVSYTYANTDGGTTESGGSSSQLVTVNIVEPDITTINKTVDQATATAGETVRYSVALTAATGVDASDVFDVVLTDNLDAGLAYAGNPTVTVGGGVGADNTIGAPTITGDGSAANPQTLVWDLGNSDIDIAEGETVTISYDVLVLDNVLANQTLNNSVVAEWTGRDGAHTTATDYERDGSDGATGLNDYITAPATVPVTTPDTNTITKTWTSDTYADGAANVRIGDTVDYTLTLSLQEGTLNNLEIVDTLPQGLEFAGVVSINGDTGPTYTAVAPFSHADITAADVVASAGASTGPTTVTWNLDTVTNTQNDGTNDDFVIVYRARVLNNVFAHTDLTIPLSNTAEMRYDTATGQVTQSDSASITALQPQLVVSKSAAPANVDPVVDGGEVVTYTVDIVNNGTAPAYDVVLQDIIPAGMQTGGVTMVSTSLDSTPLASVVPTYTAGTAIWNFDDGATPSAYTIPVGSTLSVSYSVTVDSNVAAGITLTNTAQATFYYSLNDDDASPTNSATAREEYASNTAQTSVTTAIGSVLSKTADQPSAGIGEEFTYTISVPSAANPSTTALNDVVVYDNLSVGGADLEFVQADVLATSDWSGTLVGSINASGILEITTTDAGGIDIPAGGHLELAVTVRLLDTANNNTAGLTFTNRAWYTYFNGTTTLGSDATTGATSDSMTVEHPDLTMIKTGPSPATMRIGTPATFSLDVQNTGTSAAWDVTVTDWLPNPVPGGMCDAGVTNVTATIYQADGTTVVQTLAAADYATSFTVSATQPRCEFVLTTDGVSIAPTERLIVTYDVALDADSIDGSTLTNVAGATQWLSEDPAGGVYHTYTETLTDGTVGTPDHEDAYTVTVQGAVLTAEKTVYNVTTSQSGANASPGDQLRYTITVLNTTDIPMSNFSLVDALDSLNATPMFQSGSITNVTVPAGATFAISGNTLNVDGLDIAANGTLTISFDATLVPVIDSGTVVYNQGQLSLGGTPIANTDDPAIAGTEDPTETLIASAPQFEVWKTSADITGDTSVLVPGDTLRYTITVQNIGDEDAVNAALRDQIPAYTSYVANSTTLNGNAVADPSAGVSPLQDGMPINAPEGTTPGVMHAAAAGTTDHIATITFDVVVDSNVADGTVISNQGLVNAEGAGTSGSAPEAVSDDPDTTTVDDPTRDIVGALPLVDAQKTVTISNDLGSTDVVDPGDELLYTITVTNSGGLPATGVVLTDATPANTTYVADSVTLNGIAVGNPDGGVSPLATGIDISSADLTPPLPAAGAGTLSPGGTATVTFKVTVNNDGSLATGDIITNQGVVQTNETPDEPTDWDGIDSNGDQPTESVIGPAQQLSINKSMVVVGGGSTVEAGDDIEYVITVTNIGSLPATGVVITDNLDNPVAGQLTYVPGFTFLNGSTSGTGYTAPVVSGDYGTIYGDLQPGESAVLRFRATVNDTLAIGTIVENTGVVEWNAGSQSDSDTFRFPVGGTPDSAVISGQAWRDINNNQIQDGSEPPLAGWTVEVYRDSTLIATVVTDADGNYTVNGLAPNDTSSVEYSVTFTAPGATTTTAPLGVTDSAFNDGLQTIDQITVSAGTVNQGLNLPLLPNGVVYNSMLRTPIAGATLAMLDAASGQALPASCFDDAAQQNQVTPAGGYYRFDPNFSDPACTATAGGEYLIEVTPPSTAYETGISQVIPPQSDSTTVSFSVPACIGSADDTVPATAEICEAVTLEDAPPTTVDAQTAGTNYYLHLLLDQNTGPVDNPTFNNQLFNNHIPLDPVLNNVVSITKTAARVNVSRGEMVPYTITVESDYFTSLLDLSIVDNFPAGFKYVEGSGRFDDEKVEPVVNGNQLRWDNVDLLPDERHTIKLLLIVGSGVSENDYVNRAHVENTFSAAVLSEEATATVRVVPDPNFDCTDVIGKVFDDKNLNGVQDDGEKGLPGARVVTARGLIVTSDEHGRFHVTCAMVPDEVRGSNFILKLDDRSLPTGYRVTTENPRVKRATRGKMIKFNFGATIHRAVRLDVADAVYEPDTAIMRSQWQPRIGKLLEELKGGPSVLRISYLADVESAGLVRKRVAALKEMISAKWDDLACCYELTIETEVYWRRGGPPKRRDIID